ncbi:MAG: hypothetical protein HY543_12420, partial [Deltaproteobacteria bacterium]|nr:hypothetical protein [Deltaproteobacteria bacterium]
MTCARRSRFLRTFGLVTLGLAFAAFAAPARAIDFSAHGYYRVRSSIAQDLDMQRSNAALAFSNDRFGLIAFNQMRLRIEPTLKVNDFLSLHTQSDILDNVLFGTQTAKQLEVLSPVVGTITLPTGAGSLSLVGGQAG